MTKFLTKKVSHAREMSGLSKAKDFTSEKVFESSVLYLIHFYYFLLDQFERFLLVYLYRGSIMKLVKCRDLGFDCDFMAAGSDKEEVEKTIFG